MSIDKIDYSELLELMYVRHHTRKSIAKRIGYTPQALGAWLKDRKPMPGDAVVKTAKILNIPTEKIGYYFYTEGNRYEEK